MVKTVQSNNMWRFQFGGKNGLRSLERNSCPSLLSSKMESLFGRKIKEVYKKVITNTTIHYNMSCGVPT